MKIKTNARAGLRYYDRCAPPPPTDRCAPAPRCSGGVLYEV